MGINPDQNRIDDDDDNVCQWGGREGGGEGGREGGRGGQFKVTGHRSLFYQYRKYPKHS